MVHALAEPHDPIEQLFDDVYWVHGSVRMGPGMRINRNMVIVRAGEALTVVNPVRLDAAGERELAKLGKLEHAIRLGYYHAMDDIYYKDTFGVSFWAQPGSDRVAEPAPDQLIEEGKAPPIPDAEFFVFRDCVKPECALLLKRPGLLIACDAVQHHVAKTNCSIPAKLALSAMGFMRPMNIGPPWRKGMTPPGGSLRSDFERMLALEFDSAVGAHGQVCKSGARDGLRATFETVYG